MHSVKLRTCCLVLDETSFSRTGLKVTAQCLSLNTIFNKVLGHKAYAYEIRAKENIESDMCICVWRHLWGSSLQFILDHSTIFVRFRWVHELGFAFHRRPQSFLLLFVADAIFSSSSTESFKLALCRLHLTIWFWFWPNVVRWFLWYRRNWLLWFQFSLELVNFKT